MLYCAWCGAGVERMRKLRHAQRQLESFAPYAHGVVRDVMWEVAAQLDSLSEKPT